MSFTATPTSGRSLHAPSVVTADTSNRAASARHTRSPKESLPVERGGKSAASTASSSVNGKSAPQSLKEMLLSMPNAGEDRDFERLEDHGRAVEH